MSFGGPNCHKLRHVIRGIPKDSPTNFGALKISRLKLRQFETLNPRFYTSSYFVIKTTNYYFVPVNHENLSPLGVFVFCKKNEKKKMGIIYGLSLSSLPSKALFFFLKNAFLKGFQFLGRDDM